jgi:hypothetical protein
MQKLLKAYGFPDNEADEFCFKVGLGTFSIDKIEDVLKEDNRSRWRFP